MAYWLMKSEPSAWSWQDQVKVGPAEWDGVRNYQASNNMKAMKIRDKAFFYHSVKAREIVGVVEVVREYYPDPTDINGRFGMVDVKAVEQLTNAVSLDQIKAHPQLINMALIRQSRLSVMPIETRHWEILCEMGGIEP